MKILHDIVSAKPLDGYKVDVEFDTGERAVFDCSRYLDKPYWRRLNDKAFFNQVFVGHGTLVWPDDIDIGPEDVWEFAERYCSGHSAVARQKSEMDSLIGTWGDNRTAGEIINDIYSARVPRAL